MADWIMFALGIIIGIGIGLFFGKTPSKPWSELTEKEKKMRIAIMVTLAILVIAGVVVSFLV
jgi:ABC-type antimicrobial peptide transport system permease subunit